jgi:hypothetical protein
MEPAKGPRQSQDQSQTVSVSNAEHGMTDEIDCPFFRNPKYSPFGPRFQLAQSKVKFLVYKGRVVKVFCLHASGGKCNSPENTIEGKPCFVLDGSDEQR